jgi:hypothetical protein
MDVIMKNAFEFKTEYGRTGQPTKREWSVGPIVIWAVVAILALLTGKALINLPTSFWGFFK